jgi:hypothetical protein
VHPEKAHKVSSALHYCLAQFEYKFLDAVLEYGQSIGLDARVDSGLSSCPYSEARGVVARHCGGHTE